MANNIINASPVARTVTLTRENAAGGGLGASARTLLPAITSIQDKNNIQDKIISQEQVQLNIISSQLNDFSIQMRDINGALQRIAYYIAQDTSLEILQERQKNQRDFQLAQNAVRFGKETEIERKIQNALFKPIVFVSRKVQGVLANLTNVFTTLFFGWLTEQGIQAFKAYSQGATGVLEQIKEKVLDGLRFAYDIFRLFKGGIFGIIGTIGKIALKLGKFILSDVIGGIFKTLGNIGKGIVEGGKNLLGLGDDAAQAATKAETKIAAGEAGAIARSGEKIAAKEGGSLLSKLIPGVGTGINLAIAGGRFAGGDVTGGLISTLAAVPGPIGWLGTGVDVLRDLGAFKGTPLESKEDEQKTKPKPAQTKAPKPKSPTALAQSGTPAAAPKSNAPTTPQQNAAPSATFAGPSGRTATIQFDSRFNLNATNQTDQSNQAKLDTSQPAQYGFVSGQVQPAQQTAPGTTAAPINVVKTKQQNQNLAPLEQPKPKVIVAPLPAQQQGPAKGSTSSAPPTGAVGNDTPFISSSNPDNFYALYSQISYNVVF